MWNLLFYVVDYIIVLLFQKKQGRTPSQRIKLIYYLSVQFWEEVEKKVGEKKERRTDYATTELGSILNLLPAFRGPPSSALLWISFVKQTLSFPYRIMKTV